MNLRPVCFALLFTTASVAQTTPTPTPASAPTETPPTAPADPLAEPRDLVEVQANTVANLQKAITLYEAKLTDASLPAKARADGYADLSRAYLRLGDLQKGDDTRIATYEKGRAAAKKGMAIDPKHADALFWDLGNLATIGKTKGVMNSLFMLPELRKGLARVQELQPSHLYAKQTLGEIDHAVPGIAGGSDARAEKTYMEILARDPKFTPTMVLLARLYRDKGKKDEAKKWADKVLASGASTTLPNDWRKFDKPNAQQVLRDLED